MITYDLAANVIAGMTSPEVRDFIESRLTGRSVRSIVSQSQWGDERPEDVVAVLLEKTPEGASEFAIIVDAVHRVLLRSLASIASAAASDDSELAIDDESKSLLRCFRAVDLADRANESTRQLAMPVVSLLNVLPSLLRVKSELRKSVEQELTLSALRAAAVFLRDKSDISFWSRYLECPATASYAVSGLLRFESGARHLVAKFSTLFRREILDGWPIDVASLLRRAVREHPEVFRPNVVRRIVRNAADDDGTLARRVDDYLKSRKWSDAWRLRPLQKPRVPPSTLQWKSLEAPSIGDIAAQVCMKNVGSWRAKMLGDVVISKRSDVRVHVDLSSEIVEKTYKQLSAFLVHGTRPPRSSPARLLGNRNPKSRGEYLAVGSAGSVD